jgi:hypothetical protein
LCNLPVAFKAAFVNGGSQRTGILRVYFFMTRAAVLKIHLICHVQGIVIRLRIKRSEIISRALAEGGQEE